MRKPTKKQLVYFEREAMVIIVKHGGERLPAWNGHPTFTIPTLAGTLTAHVIADSWPFIACRFTDSAAGHRATGDSNPYSGKWNFHGIDILPTFDERLNAIAYAGPAKEAA